MWARVTGLHKRQPLLLVKTSQVPHFLRTILFPHHHSVQPLLPRIAMSSPTLDYSRDDMDYSHDSATNTLIIFEPTGYASALSASISLETITTLHDHSNDSDYPDEHRPTPTTFPLPSLQHAHFIGRTSEPPRFPLPPKCKLYARLGRTAPWDEGEDIEPTAELDIAFPWLAHPQIEVLHLSMMSATKKPLPESKVKHLLLSEGNCFVGEYPRELETFVLGLSPFDGNGWYHWQKFDVRAWARGLPRTLRTLGLDVSSYHLENDGADSGLGLREFGSLRTLCLPWCLLPEEMATALPEGLENFAVDLPGWKRARGSNVGDQLLRVVEQSAKLKSLLILGYESTGLDEEGLQRVCAEKGVVLTFSSRPSIYRWPEETDAPHLYWEEECKKGSTVLLEFRKEPF